MKEPRALRGGVFEGRACFQARSRAAPPRNDTTVSSPRTQALLLTAQPRPGDSPRLAGDRTLKTMTTANRKQAARGLSSCVPAGGIGSGEQGREPQGDIAPGLISSRGNVAPSVPRRAGQGGGRGTHEQGQPGPIAWPSRAHRPRRLVPSRQLGPHVPSADLHSGQRGGAPTRRTQKGRRRKRKVRRGGKEERSCSLSKRLW